MCLLEGCGSLVWLLCTKKFTCHYQNSVPCQRHLLIAVCIEGVQSTDLLSLSVAHQPNFDNVGMFIRSAPQLLSTVDV